MVLSSRLGAGKIFHFCIFVTLHHTVLVNRSMVLLFFSFLSYFNRRGRGSGLELISGPELRRTQGEFCAFDKFGLFWEFSLFSFFWSLYVSLLYVYDLRPA